MPYITIELGKHELTESPCSYDFAIMKRFNFMRLS